MTKKLFILGISLLPLSACADEVPGLIITHNDSTQMSLPLSNIRSIKFQEGVMLIQQNNNTSHQLSVDNISLLSFADISTAIRTLAEEADNHKVSVTDLSGRSLSTDFHGTCIVTIDGKSHKIHIR